MSLSFARQRWTSLRVDRQTAAVDAAGAQAIADAVNARLSALGWNQADLVRASQVSANTIRDLQAGERLNYRTATLSRVAKALGWTPDAFDLIAAGSAPRLLPDEWDPERAGNWRPAREFEELEALAGRLSPTNRAKLLGYGRALLDLEKNAGE